MRIKKDNAILTRPVTKLFPTEYTYLDTKQTNNAMKQKLRREAAAIDELKRKYDCWEGGGIFEHGKFHCKYLLVRLNKTREIFVSVTGVLNLYPQLQKN